jgi:pilus assembly protein Flp/PilA
MEHTENKSIVVVEKKSRLQELIEDTRGANLVEYIILVGVVALIALAGYKVFGGAVDKKINDQAKGVQSINGAAAN